MLWLYILIGVVCLAIGALAGFAYRKNIAEKKIGRAEESVQKMIEDASKKAETIRKETVLQAKEEIHKLRTEFDKETKERRNEQNKLERRLTQREENLEKKRELWKYIKDHDIRLFHHLRNGIMGNAMNLPGRGGRKISVAAYKLSQKIVGFN